MRLSTRIAVALGLLVPVLVLVCGWLLYLLIAHDLHTEQDAHLKQRAAGVAKDARRLLRVTADGKPVLAQQRERDMFGAALDVGIRLDGPSGMITGGPQPAAGTKLPASATGPVTVEEGGKAGGTWRVLTRRVDGPHPGVHGRLWLFASDSAGREQLDSVRNRVAGTALVAAPVSALLAWVTVSRAAGPLRRLQRQAGGLDPGVGAARLEHTQSGVTEVDDLAATLGTALTRYDEQVLRTSSALETARSFAAAAGHELRTPMTSMGTDLDVLAEHERLEPGGIDEIVGDLRHEHARMLGLLEMLRELGRGELAGRELMGTVDFADVAEAAVADALRRTPGADLTLYQPAGPCPVRGWEHGLRTLVDNLIANALTHGRHPDGAGARVRVSLYDTSDKIVLHVDDDGPGIPPALQETMFARFQRGPGSEGHGLGLALVAQQAALHGAVLRIGDHPDGTGTRAEVRLPRRNAPADGGH